MHGLITTRHLVTNAPTIIHEFGIAAYCRCIAAAVSKKPVTFLDCVMRIPCSDATDEPKSSKP